MELPRFCSRQALRDEMGSLLCGSTKENVDGICADPPLPDSAPLTVGEGGGRCPYRLAARRNGLDDAAAAAAAAVDGSPLVKRW